MNEHEQKQSLAVQHRLVKLDLGFAGGDQPLVIALDECEKGVTELNQLRHFDMMFLNSVNHR